MFNRILSMTAVFVLFVVAFIVPVNCEAKSLSFIRDAEIENIISAYATPLFKAAGLDPSSINIYLVNDKAINAFVAGGQKLFINTGLLLQSNNAGQIIGVIAHETGHIAGGHLSRVNDAMRHSSAQNILGYVLGGAAAVISGRPDVGAAVMMGGQGIGMRSLFKYTRTQESSADQAALHLLSETGQSARGLLEFMEILSYQEQLNASHQDPYLRTHPMTYDRIRTIKAYVDKSPNSAKPIDRRFKKMFARMKAKLYAFINPLSYTLRLYKNTDNSLASRYARAVAYYRLPDMNKALPLINGLIVEYPSDPYFYELKGQMLFENGRVDEALEPYSTAVRMLPKSAVLRVSLARTQIEANNPDLLDAAIMNLRLATQREPDVTFTWHQLAIAYGRKGQMGMSSLAMAEEALLNGRIKDTIYYAGRAENVLPRGSTGWLQAQDILLQANKNKKNKKK